MLTKLFIGSVLISITIAINLQFNTAIPCYIDIMNPISTCNQLKVGQGIISNLDSHSIIQIFNKTTYQSTKVILNFSNPAILSLALYNHEVVQSKNLIFASSDDKTSIIYQSTLSRAYNSWNFTVKNMAVINDSIFIIKEISLQSYLIVPNQAALTPSNANIPFNFSNNHTSAFSKDKAILVIWDSKSNLFIYRFLSYSNTLMLLGTIETTNIDENLTQSVSFSSNSRNFIFQMDDREPIRIVTVYINNTIQIRNISSNVQIKKAMFMQKNNEIIGIFTHTNIIYYDFETLSILQVVNLTNISSEVMQADYEKSKIYVCINGTIFVYDFIYVPTQCGQFCEVCSPMIICSACISGYTLINKTCSESISHSNSTQNNSSGQNSSGLSTSTSPTGIKRPDGTILILDLTMNQQLTMYASAKGSEYSNAVLQNVVIFISAFPFLYIFLSNINFFTMCSFYVYLNSVMPNNLYDTLKSTHEALDTSMLSYFNYKFNFSYESEQKVMASKYAELGLSTNFLQTNHQSIIMLFLTLFIWMIMTKIAKNVDKRGLIYKLCDHKLSDVVFGVLLSNIAQIILPYKFVLESLTFTNIQNKFNMFFHVFFMGFFLIIIAFMIAFYGIVKVIRKGKKKNLPAQKKITTQKIAQTVSSSLDQLKNERENIYVGLNNLLFVLLVTLQNPIYFFILGQIFNLFGIYKATSYKKWRLNKIILSIYPIIFHACFVVFHYTTNENVIIYAILTCLATFFVGSFHQLMTLFIEIISSIVRQIQQRRISSQVVDSCDVKLQNKLENSNPLAKYIKKEQNKLKFQNKFLGKKLDLSAEKGPKISFSKQKSQNHAEQLVQRYKLAVVNIDQCEGQIETKNKVIDKPCFKKKQKPQQINLDYCQGQMEMKNKAIDKPSFKNKQKPQQRNIKIKHKN